jgi:subtilisin-like proprotein convertase family protein
MRLRLTAMAVTGLATAALVAAGASPAAAKTVTRTATFSQCLSPALPIADQSVVAATLNVPVPKNGKKVQGGIVTAVNSAGVRISHFFAGDLFINLVSPGGRAIGLAVSRGSTGNGYGSGPASCSGEQVLFSDAFATPISTPGSTGDDPIRGNFRPEQPLSTFAGGPARGAWTLLVVDCCAGRTGALDAFSLNLTYTYKKPVKKKKK